jgi:hypothetical protein
MTTFNFRPADVLLDTVLNPTRDADLDNAQPQQLKEACGIIPDFFVAACVNAEKLTLENVAAGMDSAYQFGGFAYPLNGTISDDGVYSSPYDDDADLAPYARYIFEDSDLGGALELFVYPYAITALRDRETRETKIGRFD